jgi:hypothetical protein
MVILRFPRVTASVILILNALLLVWSMGDFDRHLSMQRIREYLIGFPLLLIILFPTAVLFILLPRLASKKQSMVNEIATGIILTGFVVTMALCAMTVYEVSRIEALSALFYFLGIGVQIVLLALLAFMTTRTKNG